MLSNTGIYGAASFVYVVDQQPPRTSSPWGEIPVQCCIFPSPLLARQLFGAELHSNLQSPPVPGEVRRAPAEPGGTCRFGGVDGRSPLPGPPPNLLALAACAADKQLPIATDEPPSPCGVATKAAGAESRGELRGVVAAWSNSAIPREGSSTASWTCACRRDGGGDHRTGCAIRTSACAEATASPQ